MKDAKNYGFTPTKWSGVYQGIETNNKSIKILLLNELKPTPHNAALKCFATRRNQQDAAFQLMDSSGLESLSTSLEKFTLGLRRIFMPHTLSAEGWTPDKVMDLGRELKEAVTKTIPVKDFLSYHKPDEILSHYQPSEVLSHYQPSEVLRHYQPSEVLRHYQPSEVLRHYQPSEVLRHYQPSEVLSHYQPSTILSEYQPEQLLSVLTDEQRLAGLTEEQIRAYLEKIKKS
ncbi:hypothetical protein TI05_15840 [Achromatium sp. WMS3]|nr:hypothetical protein TI05_15840 [Achromatium sp. WMS3]